MRFWDRNLLCTLCCAFALIFPADLLSQAQEPTTGSGSNSRPPIVTATAELPDSPGSTQSQSQQGDSQQNSPQTQTTSGQQDQKSQRPVGTAAAEAPKVSGITAAQPAGIAIAPAKQHRTRAIVIKVGAIVGGAAALGAVIALTKATPSTPPGAR